MNAFQDHFYAVAEELSLEIDDDTGWVNICGKLSYSVQYEEELDYLSDIVLLTADTEKKEIDFDGSGYQLYMALTDGASKWKPGERERQLIFKREYLQWLQTFYGR